MNTSNSYRNEVIPVNKIIQTESSRKNMPAQEFESCSRRIKVCTLGRFSLSIDGKPLSFSGKAQQKPLDLLKALIAFGSRNVPEEQLTNVLWPESDRDSAHQSLAATLFRLRELLGIRDAVFLRDGKLTLDSEYVYVDVWAFERLLSLADLADALSQKEDNIKIVDMAMSLYKGSFMKGETGKTWHVSMRERLRIKLFRHIKGVCSYLESIERHDKALCLYQKVPRQLSNPVVNK